MGKIFKKLLSSIGIIIKRIFNIGIPLKFVVAFCALLSILCITLTRSNVIKEVGGKSDYSEAQFYIEVKNIIEDYYIDNIDRNTLADASAASMVNSIGDKWSYYMSAAQYQTQSLYSATEYTGIGIAITKDNHGCMIQSVNPGSVADSAGLHPGMVIIGIDGTDVSKMDADSVRTIIRSKLDSVIEITVAGSKEVFRVDCASTYKPNVVYRIEKTGAGYVQLPDFEAGSGTAAVNAIEYLLTQGIDSLVIDVRNNAGGLPGEVQILLDALLPEGTLFYITDKAGNEEVFKSDIVSINIPLVVLINKGTFAEAEVFASAIKDYNWGELMGEPTTGMTRTQQVIVLSDGSAINLSTKAYLTANRVDICADGGVVPNYIVFNSDESATGTTQGTTGGEQGTASTSNDEQLMEALTHLSKTVH